MPFDHKSLHCTAKHVTPVFLTSVMLAIGGVNIVDDYICYLFMRECHDLERPCGKVDVSHQKHGNTFHGLD